MDKPETPDNSILLAEYKAAVDGFHHYDSFRWRAGSMLIAGSLVLWGLLLKETLNEQAIGIASVFISALLSAWIFFANHYRQLYMTKIHRIHEIEKLLGMKLNLRLGLLGKGEISYPIFGFKGHNLDIFIYVIISILGPVLSFINTSSFSWWLLFSIPLITFTILKVNVNEKKMKVHYSKIKGSVI